MTVPSYPAAQAVAATVQARFAQLLRAVHERGHEELASQPDAQTIETIIDAAFWASLRREEGFSPKISLAFLPPERAGQPLRFEQPQPLTPANLSRLALAVERPGIHLGIWHDHNHDQLCAWGATRTIPRLCFVLEVIEPGLLDIKYRRDQESSKFGNVVVLKGDQIKEVNEEGITLPDCPSLLTALLGFGSPASPNGSVNVLVQLAVSMHAHGRGGSLLVVPQRSEVWRELIM